ncbi:glycosyltransferase 87 family protein [Nakamurella sp. GG22]
MSVLVARTTSGRLPGERSRIRPAVPLTVALIVLAALVLRFLFVDQVSGDYRAFVGPWYDELAANGGFAAVGTDIANYNPPYLYLLAAATYLPLPKIVAIKLISVIFDVVLAAFAALVVRHHLPSPVVWLSCFAAVLFAPTVVVNSAAWGQCDSIYAAFCVGCLYFLLRGKPWWACVFFGIALSFKLQAIFFLPVLIIVLIVNRRRVLALLAVPVTFLVLLIPAALTGRGWGSLLMIYPNQVDSGGSGGGVDAFSGGARFAQVGGGAGTTSSLTQNAPTIFQWVTSGNAEVWKYLGLGAAAVVVAAIATAALLRRRPLSGPQMVALATTLALAVPFVLPEMHERYFYLADVLTIVTAFYVRRYWVVAAVVSACSLLSYAPFLWQRTVVALPLVSFAEFLAVIATGLVFVDVMLRDGSLLRRPAGPRRPVDSAVQ